MGVSELTFKWVGGIVSGVWHRPSGEVEATLVLAHGAGHGMNTRLLVDMAEGLSDRDVAVVRFNFPYAEAGRRAPDPQPKLEECWRSVAETVAKESPRPYIGGKSMGGRIASHIVADGFEAAGLVFLGYPLHPPGKPERIRDAHLARIKAPMLFLQGKRDPFATRDLLHQTIGRLASAKLVEIEGGDHSFKVRGRPVDDVTTELVREIATFVLGQG